MFQPSGPDHMLIYLDIVVTSEYHLQTQLHLFYSFCRQIEVLTLRLVGFAIWNRFRQQQEPSEYNFFASLRTELSSWQNWWNTQRNYYVPFACYSFVTEAQVNRTAVGYKSLGLIYWDQACYHLQSRLERLRKMSCQMLICKNLFFHFCAPSTTNLRALSKETKIFGPTLLHTNSV